MTAEQLETEDIESSHTLEEVAKGFGTELPTLLEYLFSGLRTGINENPRPGGHRRARHDKDSQKQDGGLYLSFAEVKVAQPEHLIRVH